MASGGQTTAAAAKKPREAAPAAAAATAAPPSRPRQPVASVRLLPSISLQLEEEPTDSGSFGDVYRAKWTDDGGSDVAVKVMRHTDAESVAEFHREVAFLHALPFHPNVLQLHGIVKESEKCWVVTEWMENGSLIDYLERAQPDYEPAARRLQLGWTNKLSLALQCARGLNFLHTLPAPNGPLLHRDIKTDNFLVDEDGKVKIGQLHK